MRTCVHNPNRQKKPKKDNALDETKLNKERDDKGQESPPAPVDTKKEKEETRPDPPSIEKDDDRNTKGDENDPGPDDVDEKIEEVGPEEPLPEIDMKFAKDLMADARSLQSLLEGDEEESKTGLDREIEKMDENEVKERANAEKNLKRRVAEAQRMEKNRAKMAEEEEKTRPASPFAGLIFSLTTIFITSAEKTNTVLKGLGKTMTRKPRKEEYIDTIDEVLPTFLSRERVGPKMRLMAMFSEDVGTVSMENILKDTPLVLPQPESSNKKPPAKPVVKAEKKSKTEQTPTPAPVDTRKVGVPKDEGTALFNKLFPSVENGQQPVTEDMIKSARDPFATTKKKSLPAKRGWFSGNKEQPPPPSVYKF